MGKIIIPLIVLIVSLIFSAFFSSSEIVYTAVSKTRLETEAAKGSRPAKSALRLVNNFGQSITAILLGNNIANILSASMATLIALILLEDTLGSETATLIGSLVILVITVTFGEITPKIIGKKYAFKLSLLSHTTVNVFRIIFFPITYVISLLYKFFDLFVKKRLPEDPVTEEELVEMVDTIESEGLIDEKQGDLLRSAIQFADTDAFEVMTPRVDVLAFNIEDDVLELLDNPETFTYSRIPVYEDTIDNVIGILPTKYLYPYLINKEAFDLRALLVKPLFVPHGKTISSILKLFKETHQHIAIVIDEYGGTEGIITMEDIVEEIVGEIWDENDEVEEPLVSIGHDIYLVDGSMHIEDFMDYFDCDEENESDYATVGGWCQEQLGRFGLVGDTFEFKRLQITVIDADEFTIEKIQVRVLEKALEDD